MTPRIKNTLDELSKVTKIVADTGDLEQIKRFNSIDVTTNPSLILKALKNRNSNEFKNIIERIKSNINNNSDTITQEENLLTFSVLLGAEILKMISGRVSIEIPSCYSFDQTKTLKKAYRVVDLFECEGISKDRVLIKIIATWEGIQAAKILEKENIHCNLTLVFSLFQAALCADNGITLISPFVGRIYDWYKDNDPDVFKTGDPGVQSAIKIYQYIKQFGYSTEVMGASFRNIDQILALAGCDLLTIAPLLLRELESRKDFVERKLCPDNNFNMKKIQINQADFHWKLNQDIMSEEKLFEGIRIFHHDFEIQKKILQKLL